MKPPGRLCCWNEWGERLKTGSMGSCFYKNWKEHNEGVADGEEGNKGLEATKQESISRMQRRDPCPWDAHGEKGSASAEQDKDEGRGAGPPGKAFQNVPSPQSQWLQGFWTFAVLFETVRFFFQEEGTHKYLLSTYPALIKMPRG